MSEPFDHEARLALGLLDRLARATPEHPVPEPSPDDAEAAIERIHLEALALVAYDLDSRAASPGLRERLVAHFAGDETQEVEPVAPSRARRAATPPAESARVLPLPTREPIEPAPAKARRSRWPAVLAALFALAAAGLGLWSASLASEVAERDARIRRLAADLERAQAAEKDLAAARLELVALRKQYSFVTSPAVTVFSLRPSGEASGQPFARAHLWVAPDHQQWVFEARGLAPEPDDKDYQLWFLIGSQPFSAGVFSVAQGIPAGLAARAMPRGTTAVAVTLERKGGSPLPTTPVLLIGDQSLQL